MQPGEAVPSQNSRNTMPMSKESPSTENKEGTERQDKILPAGLCKMHVSLDKGCCNNFLLILTFMGLT